MDQLLQNLGIDRESLQREEIETLERWAKALSQQQLTVAQIKEYINSMIGGLERELAGHEYPKGIVEWLYRGRRNRAIKARLYNYLLLRDFLTAPDRARSYVEKNLKNLEVKKS